MNMKDVVEQLVTQFGPADTTNPGPLIERILKIMPGKEVPDDTFNKIVRIGKALKGAGVPR